MDDWLEVCVTTPTPAQAEPVAALLQTLATADEGVSIEQQGDPDNLDPAALLPATAVKLFVRATRATAEWRADVAYRLQTAGHPPPVWTLLADQDWANAWKQHYRPLRIGRSFLICPSWCERPPLASADCLITLDPGMAFGTGTHPTTQLCLAALETHVFPGARVLDLGTGSGVLAIGARLLGAESVLAVDNDPTAVAVAQENIDLNDLRGQIAVRCGELADVPERGWDVIVANILAPVLMELLATADLLGYLAADGRLIMSGVLETQHAALTAVVAACGGVVTDVTEVEDWVAPVVQRAASPG